MIKKHNFSEELSKLIPRLRRYALVLTKTKEDAEDLQQATLERAITKQNQWQENTHLDRWTFTIMSSLWKNEIRSRCTRQGNGNTENIQELLDITSTDTSIKNMEGTFLVNQVFKEVMLLSEDQREAILLVYVEGLQYQEAADILAIPTGTLMSRLARARITLATTLADTTHSDDNIINFREHQG